MMLQLPGLLLQTNILKVYAIIAPLAQKEIEGLLSAQTVFLLKTLFKEVKNILPTEDIFNIETLRLVVTDTPGWEVPHFAEHKGLKVEHRWCWSFTCPYVKKEQTFSCGKVKRERFRRCTFRLAVPF